MPEAPYIVSEDNAAIFHDFLGEAPQLLELMEGALLGLAQNATATEQVDAVMRSLHTLKGIFGFLAMQAMNDLCHKAEGALEPYHSSQAALPSELLQWLLKALDAIRGQVAEISLGLASGSFPLVSLSGLEAAPAAAAPSEAAQPQLPDSAKAQAAEGSQDRFIRIRVEKMDALLELVGEMAICQSQVAEGLKAYELAPALGSELGRLGKISRELQETVLSLRLVPVEPLFLRAGRVAHDIALKTGKSIEFTSEGRETELDKRMVEELSEPLMHLIRNAVDHGLEGAAQREALGKQPQGHLQLRASHQGGDFLLELEDDGRGLDLAKLAARGRALGLLQGAEEQDEQRVTSLIFEPGFSTAESVTDISGRGVGLDAVRTRIQSLKGVIQVDSLPGLGCRFSIRLPLTMALVEGILVRVGSERYVVPAGQIRKFVALESGSRHALGNGRGWLESMGESLPMIDLARFFGQPEAEQPRQVALHIESLGRKGVLIVDEVLGKQQVVAKGLGADLQKLEGVAGGAILGDGRVSLILDLEALMGRERAAAAA